MILVAHSERLTGLHCCFAWFLVFSLISSLQPPRVTLTETTISHHIWCQDSTELRKLSLPTSTFCFISYLLKGAAFLFRSLSRYGCAIDVWSAGTCLYVCHSGMHLTWCLQRYLLAVVLGTNSTPEKSHFLVGTTTKCSNCKHDCCSCHYAPS